MLRITVYTGIILSLLVVNVMAEPNNVAQKIDEIFSFIESIIEYLGTRLLSFVKIVAKAICLALIALGVLLWASGFSPYRGKQMVIGGIILLILSSLL